MSNYQQRLYDHQVDPPANAWGKIADALENERLYDFRKTLYDSATPPPPAVWDRIAAELDNEASQQPVAAPRSNGRVIPMFIRYAAAAVIIAAVATTAFFLFDKKPEGPVLSEVQPAAKTPVGVKADSGLVTAQTTPGAGAATISDTEQVRTVAGTEKPTRVSQASYNPRRARTTGSQDPDPAYQNPLYAYEDHIPEIAERYVTLMTPDGDFIRMSKKLGPLVCCVTGQEQDEQCKNQIRKLQQELASSPVGQGNVLDVLDIVTSLNNGTQL